MSWPSRSASTTVSASAATSLKPRLRPWPAIGWMPCAASPASAKRGATKSRASVRPSGQARGLSSTRISPSFRPKRCSSSCSKTRSSPATSLSASCGALGPDDRRRWLPVQRQDGERAGGQEMLLGAAIVRALMRDGADDARLAIVPVHRLDAGHVAQLRVDAVGGDQQPRLQRHPVGQMHGDAGAIAVEGLTATPSMMSMPSSARAAAQRAVEHPCWRPCGRTARRARPRRRRSGTPDAPDRRCANR